MRPLAGILLLVAGLFAWGFARLPYAVANFERMTSRVAEGAAEPADLPDSYSGRPAPHYDSGPARPLVAAVQIAPSFAPLGSPSEQQAACEGSRRETAVRLGHGSPTSAGAAPTGSRNGPEVDQRANPGSPPHPLQNNGFALAEQAYTSLRAGERRKASSLFSAALAAAPNQPQAAEWEQQLSELHRRVFLSGYLIARDDGRTADPGALPGFGGSQHGIGVRYVLDPLANRPIALGLRWIRSPQGERTAQELVAGIDWQPLGRSGPLFAAERRFGVDGGGIDAFQLRASGGVGTDAGSPFDLSVYADAGLADLADPRAFAGAQAFAGYRFHPSAGIGAAGWASWQEGEGTQELVEAGPAVQASFPLAGATVGLAASYRVRLSGAEGRKHGPVLTLSVLN